MLPSSLGMVSVRPLLVSADTPSFRPPSRICLASRTRCDRIITSFFLKEIDGRSTSKTTRTRTAIRNRTRDEPATTVPLEDTLQKLSSIQEAALCGLALGGAHLVRSAQEALSNIERMQTVKRVLGNESLRESLGCNSASELQQLGNALTLSEGIYKCIDKPETEVVRWMTMVKRSFPPGFIDFTEIQFSRPHVKHRYGLAESAHDYYVVFMGTKMPMDYVASAAFWQDQVQLCMSSLSSNNREGLGSPDGSNENDHPLLAHQGFVSRSRGLPIVELFVEARRRGKRLVLCGHSLGGAVAQLNTIYLLERLPVSHHKNISCVTFATPAFSNRAFFDLVVRRGWTGKIRSYLTPEDPIPRIFLRDGGRNEDNDAYRSYTEGGLAEPRLLAEMKTTLRSLRVRTEKSKMRNGLLSSLTKLGDTDTYAHAKSPAASHQNKIEADDTPFSKQGVQSHGKHSVKHLLAVLQEALEKVCQMVRRLGSTTMSIANMPLRAAPQYFPIGRQLYILSDGVHCTRTSFQESLPAVHTHPNGIDMRAGLDFFRKWRDWEQAGQQVISNSLNMNRDNLEGQATKEPTIPEGSLINGWEQDSKPGAQISLFRHHRMKSYRRRILHIIESNFNKSQATSWESFQGNESVRLSSQLGPAILVFRAQAIPLIDTSGRPVVEDVYVDDSKYRREKGFVTSEDKIAHIPMEFVELHSHPYTGVAAALIRGLKWPFALFSGHTVSDDQRTAVLLRIVGEGLCNVNSLWVNQESFDIEERSKRIVAKIIRQPTMDMPKSATEVMAACLYVKQVVGLVTILLLQIPILGEILIGLSEDCILAEANVPYGVVRRAQQAAKDPNEDSASNAPVLGLVVQTDFYVLSVPIKVSSFSGIVRPDNSKEI